MKNGFIYGLRCPLSGEIRYVGQTIKTLQRRLSEHKCDKRHNPYKINWIKKLDRLELLDLLKIEILEKCSEVQLNEKERLWIQKFKNEGNKLVNLTDGGDGVPGRICDKETRKKISESNKGKKMSDKAKKRISDKKKGIKLTTKHKISIRKGVLLAYKEGRIISNKSETQKIKISNGLKKYFNENPRPKKEKIKKEKKPHIYTDEDRKKISEKTSGKNNPFYGKKHGEETKRKIGEKNREHMLGEKNHFFGKKHSEKTKEKIANKLKEKPKKVYYIYDENLLFVTKGISNNLLEFFKIKSPENICRFCNKNKKYKNYFIKDEQIGPIPFFKESGVVNDRLQTEQIPL